MKKILFAAFAAATIGLAGYNVIESIQTAELSDLALKNIEALSDDEIVLDEIEIICGQEDGPCYTWDGIYYVGEYTYNKCRFTGDPLYFCTALFPR